MDFKHLADDRGRAGKITKSPTGHCVCFGKTVYDNGAFFHSFNFSYRNMALITVSEFRINFIGKNHDVGSAKNFRYFFKMFSSHNSSGGVVGERKNKKFCFWGNCGAKFFRSKTEIVFAFGFNGNDLSAGKTADRVIANERGDWKKHFVTVINNSANSEIDCFGTADGYKNIACIVFEVKSAFEIFGSFLAKFDKTGIGSIPSMSFFKGFDTCLTDMPGSFEVGFADGKRNNVFNFCRKVEEFSYSGRFKFGNFLGKNFVVINQYSVASFRL